MTLTADRNAPTSYSDKTSKKIATNREVNLLCRRRQRLADELRNTYGSVRKAPNSDPVRIEKASVDAAIHTLKENLRNKQFRVDRKRYFETADTLALEAQFRKETDSVSAI